jgi:RNA polymerase sigma-70 factor, ECF subfamily
MANFSGINFEDVYADYQPKILRYLSQLINPVDAEDLTQEVFVKVNIALETFRGESKLSTWIYRIASNTAIDRIRSSSFRQSLQESTLDDSSGTLGKVIWTGDSPASLEQFMLQKDRLDCFTKFVQKLPVNYRMVIILSEIEQLACNEIAEILGLSSEVVKIRLHRGRTRLFEELRAYCKPEEWL